MIVPFQMNVDKPTSVVALLLLALCATHLHSAQSHSIGDHNNGQETTNNNGNGGHKGNSKHLALLNGGGGGGSRCQTGWIWFNNKCWVTTSSRRDFAHAIELCKRMYNSSLPTIHSEEENEFLRQNIELHNSPIWLHARHDHQHNKTRWMDGSPVNYTRWDIGQPSDKSSLICIKTEESWYMKKAEPVDGQTECVSFWEDAKWGTQVGCQVLLPVVCEKRLASQQQSLSSRFADQLTSSLSSSPPPMDASLGGPQLSGAPINCRPNLPALLLLAGAATLCAAILLQRRQEQS